MNAPIDAFYSVYMTGKQGQGFALVAFTRGRVIGADAGGFVLDGEYSDAGVDLVSVSLRIKAPPHAPRIQGGVVGPQGEESQLDFQMSRDFASRQFVRIETQRGPVNVKFVRLRELDG
jgi:hypothetical protein